ncbi:hypothetical protein TBK1r_62850 [Stieleria magnilauensis]|uniref:Uncharacterized protein n=1 Tax=Stieleria magnilauensis TaxID=2527963 RepID=A0ABX5Y2S7_9BACT|nr:hypothetical protein TBK1r_62850 [Planctomycetes bacterium TBK1r]
MRTVNSNQTLVSMSKFLSISSQALIRDERTIAANKHGMPLTLDLLHEAIAAIDII